MINLKKEKIINNHNKNKIKNNKHKKSIIQKNKFKKLIN